MPSTSPQRKKRQSSQSSDDSKSKRGRPRVEAQDETAQDRRRTQIRLAQRAYRQRKETTISSLKKETNELQRFIKQMNNNIKLIKDSAMTGGMGNSHPDLLNQLNEAAQQFAKMSKRANIETEETLEDDEVEPDDVVHRLSVNEYKEINPHKRARLSGHLPSPQSTARGSDPGIGMGYSLLLDHLDSLPPDNDEDISDNQLSLFSGSSSGMNVNLSPQPDSHFPLSWVESLQQLHLPSTRSPSLHISQEPKAPFTFSFQETTFARRLHRATLERGFRFISHPHLRPEVFRRKFKLSLMYGSQGDIREKIKGLLLRSATDTLEWTDHPFLHVGGAGTHYPRRDEHGNPIPKPNSYQVRSIGPQKLARLVRDPDSGSVNAIGPAGKDLIIDIEGFEGEWFDAHDVEGYLREKGIEIGGQADFAEGDVLEDPDRAKGQLLGSADVLFPPCEPSGSPLRTPDLLNLDSTASADQISLPGPPLMTSTSIDWTTGDKDSLPLQKQADMWDYWSDGDNGGAGGMFDYGSSGNTNNNNLPDFGIDPGSNGVVAAIGSKRYIEKTHVTVDVAKLVDELSKRAVCLGRSPGYRRHDVDRAFNMAVAAF